MARLPFFASTWQRKARLSGVVFAVFLGLRLLAWLSKSYVGLGWDDIPVSAVAVIYLGFVYVELWILLERHTRPFLSFAAALFLAGLCLASPLLDFDPVATGSVPAHLRFWEPTLGVERAPGQRVAYLTRSYLEGAGDESDASYEAARDQLFPKLGLAPRADELSAAETEELRTALSRVATEANLLGVRGQLFVRAVELQLAASRADMTLSDVDRRIDCLAAALEEPPPSAKEAGAAPHGGLPEECGASPAKVLHVAAANVDAVALAEQGATPSFLDTLEEQVDSWLEALEGDPAGPGGSDSPVKLRLDPPDHPALGLAGVAATWLGRADGATELQALRSVAERYRKVARRRAAARRSLGVLSAQVELVPAQVVPLLKATPAPGVEGQLAWSVVDAPELQGLLDGRGANRLVRWLHSRPAQVSEYALQLPAGDQRERFLHYVSQTQHWHLRDPEAILAELARAEDEQRRTPELGAVVFPPVKLCRAMAQQELDAVVLQLAHVDRRNTKKLRLLLVQRDPCLVVWEHSVPIYSQADVLGSTAEDAGAMTKGAAAFFAAYPLGTDYLGRDMLSRLVKGTEGFFLPGLIAVALGLGIGVLLGALAGYLGGRVDKVISFFTTMLGSFPRLVFILLVCTIPEEPSMKLIGAMTGVLFIPQVAEAVRRRVLALKAEDFILASRAHGLSLPRILFYHIVWLQCFPEIVRQALYLFVYVIFLETALSYLEGPGAPPEIPSWGRMLANATAAMFRGQYWHALVPTAAIVFTTLGVASLGDVVVGQAKEERL